MSLLPAHMMVQLPNPIEVVNLHVLAMWLTPKLPLEINSVLSTNAAKLTAKIDKTKDNFVQ